MGFLVFDIETVLDPALPYAPKKPDEFPPPPFHMPVTIGAMSFKDDYTPELIGVVPGVDERERLARFVHLSKGRTLVSWNGRSFDCPVVASRALRHGINMSRWYGSRDTRYRFSDAGHFDVKDYLGDFGASRFAGLDTCAKLVGFPGKVGVDGSQVGEMVAAGRQSEVDAYCLCDVVQTAALFLRVQWMRGLVPNWSEVATAFFECIDRETRVSPVAKVVNREEFYRVG